MKSIHTINPAITENMDYVIFKVRASLINLTVGVSLNDGVSPHFISRLSFVSRLALQTC